MAEHEVIKPAKRIGKQIKDKEGSVWKRILMILGEILIIVFAISFSLFMERRREHKHEKNIEKEFLTELRSDLTSKLDEFRRDSVLYDRIYQSWRYLYRASGDSIIPNRDSIDNAAGAFSYVLLLNSNNSLFESMKASGNLYVIHNKKLLQDIIGLYQENIPGLLKSIELFYYPTNNAINDILDERWIRKKGQNNLGELLVSDNNLRNKLGGYYKIQIVLGFYGKVITRSQQIIEEINKELD